MSFYRVHHRFAAWVAMFALVLSALAPTVAHAWVAAADEGQLIEVCSATGMVWLKAGGPEAAAGQAANPNTPMADMAQQCPWCSFHGSSAGLPPAMPEAAVVVLTGHAMPGWSAIALPRRHLLSALARAPPFPS